MFYEVLMQKRAGKEKYYGPSAKVLRAKRELLKMSPDDQMEALYGATYDYGIDDEQQLRREIGKRRAIGGAIVGSAVGGIAGRPLRPKLPLAARLAIGAGVGALAGRATVSQSRSPVYTDQVKRVRALQKRLPTLSDEEKMQLMDIL